MYLRAAPELTLLDVKNGVRTGTEITAVNPTQMEVRLIEDPKIIFRGAGNDGLELPITIDGVEAMGNFLDIPIPFLRRVDPDLKEILLNNLLRRGDAANIEYSEHGLVAMRPPGMRPISPISIIDIASRTVSPDALVVDWWQTNADFRLDVIVPVDFDRGVGGDREVGDITAGGLRFGHDSKHNLAPWVQPYLYRLMCTNGYEIEDTSLTVDARSLQVEDVLAELEGAAQRAFGEVERNIEAFYELREIKVENPEREIVRFATEAGLPARTIANLALLAPELPDDVTRFDIVNLITNYANSPGVKVAPRRNLERLGGTIVNDHAQRCGHCRSRLD